MEVYLQIIHRIAFLVAIIPAIVIPILPQIFDSSADRDFQNNSLIVLIKILKISLIGSLISGLLRIHSPFTLFLAIKIILGIVTLLSFYIINIDLDHEKFEIISWSRVILMFITAFFGLMI